MCPVEHYRGEARRLRPVLMSQSRPSINSKPCTRFISMMHGGANQNCPLHQGCSKMAATGDPRKVPRREPTILALGLARSQYPTAAPRMKKQLPKVATHSRTSSPRRAALTAKGIALSPSAAEKMKVQAPPRRLLNRLRRGRLSPLPLLLWRRS